MLNHGWQETDQDKINKAEWQNPENWEEVPRSSLSILARRTLAHGFLNKFPGWDGH